MLKYLRFYQCAILLALFERIVCPMLNDPIRNFGLCDIYNKVTIEGDFQTGRFIFIKEIDANNIRQVAVPFSNILYDTLELEGNNHKVISFFAAGAQDSNFNIKFKFKKSAREFIEQRTLPSEHELIYGRIYSNWRPAFITYDFLKNDLGFAIVRYDNTDARVHQRQYLFKRSEIDKSFRILTPYNLYLRSASRMEDYFILFHNQNQMDIFFSLFPGVTFNDAKTFDYYFIR